LRLFFSPIASYASNIILYVIYISARASRQPQPASLLPNTYISLHRTDFTSSFFDNGPWITFYFTAHRRRPANSSL
jgi:hypothetical protein